MSHPIQTPAIRAESGSRNLRLGISVTGERSRNGQPEPGKNDQLTPLGGRFYLSRAGFESSPKSVAETLYATGFRALSEGRSKEAQKCFALMAGVAPFDARPWVGLGASFEQQGNWKGALGMYTFGSSVSPKSLYCKLGEARMLAKAGQYKEAQSILDAAEANANHIEEVQLVERLRGEL